MEVLHIVVYTTIDTCIEVPNLPNINGGLQIVVYNYPLGPLHWPRIGFHLRVTLPAIRPLLNLSKLRNTCGIIPDPETMDK